MRGLSPQQHTVLLAAIDEVGEGTPPNLIRLARRCNLTHPSVRAAVSGLITKGYLRQSYPGGPYIPIRNTKGLALELRLVPVVDS